MRNYRSSEFNQNEIFSSISQEVSSNKVLRNTYFLLTISLIPSIFGTLFGLSSSINKLMLLNPGITTILFIFGSFALMFAIEKNKTNSLGIIFLLCFTFFMGIMLSRLIGIVLGMNNGQQLIFIAFSGTAAIFSIMATLSSIIKKDLSNFQKWLSIGLVAILIVALANIFMKINALVLTISVISMSIFSAFILVDLQRIIKGGETNYISATLAIYLNIYNVFSNLLIILASLFGTNRD
ncbi:MAG: Bax inhibitor-1 family protein [Bordetella sp.]|nr:MAG: Bax inhibitor-1 family protein [Bordetella sp.]